MTTDSSNALAAKLKRETFWSFGAKGVNFFLYYALVIVLSKLLGAERYGQWSVFLSAYTIVLSVSYFGLNESAERYVAEYRDRTAVRRLILDAAVLRIALSLAAAVLLVLLRERLAVLLGDRSLSQFLLLAAPLLVLQGLVELSKNLSRGLHRLKYTFFITTSEHFLKLTLAVVLLAMQVSITRVIVAFTIAMGITGLVSVGLLLLSSPAGEITREKRFFDEILRYSLPLLVVTLGFIVITEIDVLMLGRLATQSETGQYAVAKRVVAKLPHVTVALAAGTMPVLVSTDGSDDSSGGPSATPYGQARALSRLLWINTGVFVPVTISLVLAAPHLVPFLFGQEYLGAIRPLQILTVYLFFGTYSILFGQFLNYRGLARKRARYVLTMLTANIVLNSLLIPRYGAPGAAVATSLSYVPYTLLCFYEVTTELEEFTLSTFLRSVPYFDTVPVGEGNS